MGELSTPCIEWPGARFTNGYGAKKIRGKQYRVHRLEWERVHGPIPEGLCVLHRCDNPPCYNIDHLFLGTIMDNVRDMVAKGRQNYTGRPRGACCKRGHPLDGSVRKGHPLPDLPPGGTRRTCRECIAGRTPEHYLAQTRKARIAATAYWDRARAAKPGAVWSNNRYDDGTLLTP